MTRLHMRLRGQAASWWAAGWAAVCVAAAGPTAVAGPASAASVASVSAASGSAAIPAPASCEALRASYQAALAPSQACEPRAASATASCAALRPALLGDACRCQVSVNPARTRQLDALIAAYEAQACAPEPMMCRRMCAQPDTRCADPGARAQGVCGGH